MFCLWLGEPRESLVMEGLLSSYLQQISYAPCYGTQRKLGMKVVEKVGGWNAQSALCIVMDCKEDVSSARLTGFSVCWALWRSQVDHLLRLVGLTVSLSSCLQWMYWEACCLWMWEGIVEHLI